MRRPKALVSGALANKPFNGGNAWSRLSWVLGLQRLGFEVFFVEQLDGGAAAAAGTAAAADHSASIAYFKAVMEPFGLSGASALIANDGPSLYGPTRAELAAWARQADLLFNFGGHLTQPELFSAPACKMYYDDDPGFTQFWRAAGQPGSRLEGHDCYFTLGANLGSGDCAIPTNDLTWRPTRPPVVLADWPVCAPPAFDRFTTVASWRGAYGPVEYGGKRYGLKVHEFRRFIELPRRSGRRFEIALQIHPGDRADLEALLAHGWEVVDPRRVAASCDDFRGYVQTSGAECSVAQGIYVETNSGWFSDRTVRYLASGRPALVQDTGFSRHLPVGEGLLAFRNIEEAVDGAERMVRDYPRHCRAARRVAEECFDSDRVIRRLLEEAGLNVP